MTPPEVDWNNIDTVLLDMDGTILDLHYDNHFWLHYVPKAFAESHNVTYDEAEQILHKKFTENQGTLNWYCLDFWTKELDLNIPSLKTKTQDKIQFRSDAKAFLTFLKNNNKRVIMATNAHRKTLEIKQLNEDFHHFFERLISSHDYGYPKEHQGFWSSLEADLTFEKSSTMFIDDSLSVLSAAKNYGIGYLFGIAQPDSQKEPRPMQPFFALESFSDIMPTR